MLKISDETKSYNNPYSKALGFETLVNTIGKEFINDHQEFTCFNYGDTEQGVFCFLGVDLHPENMKRTLSADIDDWDVYATCYVTDKDIIMDKCKLP
jgi:hypothetical protein